MENPQFKSYQRVTNNRLICREQAAIPIKGRAEDWRPQLPQEPNNPEEGPGEPSTQTITLMLNFDHELEDRSGKNNDALFEFTNNQLMFTEGRDSTLSFAVDFNHNSNSTFDKIWVPFSNSTQIVYDTPTGFSIFTRIKPTVVSDLGTSTTPGPAPASNRLKDFGGPKRNHVNQQLYVIWWGSGWNSGNDLDDKNTLKSHFNSVVASDYFKALWEYNDTKPITTITHVDNTVFAIPGGSAVTFQNIIDVILNSRTNGIIPQFTGTSDSGWNFDLTHLYLVMNPPNKSQPPGGFAGATAWATDPVTNITFNWSNVHSPRIIRDNNFEISGFNAIQTCEQAAMHELMHAYLTPTIGACTQGNGWLFSESGFCNNCQHGPPGTGCNTSTISNLCECGHHLKVLSGTNILVEGYWSNMKGTCIAPGTGDSWTPRPAGTGGTPSNPSIRRYIFQKLDDLDNGATAAIGPDGIIYFNVKKNGTEYKVKTTTGVVVVNQWADIWFTFDGATNSPRIYVNNQIYTAASTEVLLWNNTHSHTIIANYNMGGTTGQLRAAMDDFRIYRNGVVTSQGVENVTDNGLTIQSIDETPGTTVAIVNRVRVGKPLENAGVSVTADVVAGDVAAPITSFTSDSFTTTSFTV